MFDDGDYITMYGITQGFSTFGCLHTPKLKIISKIWYFVDPLDQLAYPQGFMYPRLRTAGKSNCNKWVGLAHVPAKLKYNLNKMVMVAKENIINKKTIVFTDNLQSAFLFP
jgi:hypothetical protein